MTFNGVKVFSATMAHDRAVLGEKVTDWMREHDDIEVVDYVITQSSDAEFHCLAITLFYNDPTRGRRRATPSPRRLPFGNVVDDVANAREPEDETWAERAGGRRR